MEVCSACIKDNTAFHYRALIDCNSPARAGLELNSVCIEIPREIIYQRRRRILPQIHARPNGIMDVHVFLIEQRKNVRLCILFGIY